MKLYVAFSWKNSAQPVVVAALLAEGHAVYDFRNPPGRAGFRWRDVGIEGAAIDAGGLRRALDHEDARAGFAADRNGLDWCDAGVLVLPCGRSAHIEAGYLWGHGKPVYVLWPPVPEAPELMYSGLGPIVPTLGELLKEIRSGEWL